jgi:hypothetical protein
MGLVECFAWNLVGGRSTWPKPVFITKRKVKGSVMYQKITIHIESTHDEGKEILKLLIKDKLQGNHFEIRNETKDRLEFLFDKTTYDYWQGAANRFNEMVLQPMKKRSSNQ